MAWGRLAKVDKRRGESGGRVVQGGGCRMAGARQLAKGSLLLSFFQMMARVGDGRLTVRFRASLKHKKR